jgi:hypothetical protein
MRLVIALLLSVIGLVLGGISAIRYNDRQKFIPDGLNGILW